MATNVHSVTEVKTFRSCRLKWFYRYKEALIPRYGRKSTFLGTLVHKGLEVYYRNSGSNEKPSDNNIKAMNEAIISAGYDKLKDTESNLLLRSNGYLKEEDIYDTMMDAQRIAKFTVNHMSKNFEPFEVVAVETNGYILDGRVSFIADMVGKPLIGSRYFILDWKTVSSIKSDNTWLGFDDQANVYLASKLMDQEAPDVFFVFIRRKAPEEPKVLKRTKGLSKDKRQYTTAQIYFDKLQELDLNPKDYVDFLKYLKDNEHRFLKAEKVTYTQEQTDEYLRELEVVVNEMESNNVSIYPCRNYKTTCLYCEYRELCYAKIDGTYETVLTNFFSRKES